MAVISRVDMKPYTFEDFQTTAPYEDLAKIRDPFQRGMAERAMAEYARGVGFIGFRKAFKDYLDSLRRAAAADPATPENVSQFEQQKLELDTGAWIADDSGVWHPGAFGEREIACSHPIMPVERLKNIDTGELKIRLAFRRGGEARKVWNEVLADFDTISNAKNIVALSRIGVSVTSGKRAQNLVDYLAETLDRNYDIIPEVRSTSRMGWNEEGFSPYVDGIVFDGNPGFEKLFRSIGPHGRLEPWLDEALAARKYSITAKIVLAASFASVLIGPLGCLPFFVHLWGMDSGTGKSVAQMLAAAVWGNPFIGNPFFPTFKATSVGFEVIAGFLNSLPVFVDELQLAKDAKGRVVFNVYELAAGVGKLRSNRSLSLAATPTWANCFITSGETPLVGENEGAGALNRVIEIECKADSKVIEDGHRTASAVKENYGHAGKLFVKKLTEPNHMELAKKLYEAFYDVAIKNDTTEKQAMAAAIIVTADALATEWIFRDGEPLTVQDMAEFLKSKEAVSAADRGYNYMCDWVAQNANHFKTTSSDFGEVYGEFGEGADRGWVYIVRATAWNKACQDAGINPKALLSHLKSRGLLQTRDKGYTRTKRIGGVPADCVVMKLREDEDAWATGEPDAWISDGRTP